jgi:NAD(P)H-hydrate epimerase
MSTGLELLTADEMARADKRAVLAGVPSLTLMENAGRVVADAAWAHLQAGDRVTVLAGPGNNGGDGFVAARLLAEHGCDVTVALLGARAALKGDAAEMARRWAGTVVALEASACDSAKLVIDAIFGAGLARDVDGVAGETIRALNERPRGVKVIAVDVPSGLDGNTGGVRGVALRADETVTFFRLKPGHVLYPGRQLCGRVSVADIGIPRAVLAQIATSASVLADASADTFATLFPWRKDDGHKYDHGHAVVVSGPALQSGAARLAARGALRVGAGLVTVASPPSGLPENAAHLTAVMLKVCGSARALCEILDDTRKNAVLIGPGAGVGAETAEMVLAALGSDAGVVLDADALTSFSDGRVAVDAKGSVGFGFTGKGGPRGETAEALFDAILARPERSVVLTPHAGEFKRLFADLAEVPSKLERTRAAAKRSGAVVLLKGADTVIAAPDGHAAVNTNAPGWLATAGSGDVLAGFVAGLLAQRVAAYDAACMAVWLHGACANLLGAGLIAEDLPDVLPQVLRGLAALKEQGA